MSEIYEFVKAFLAEFHGEVFDKPKTEIDVNSEANQFFYQITSERRIRKFA